MTTRKPKPKTDLAVAAPDMEQLDQTLQELTAHMRPMLTASDSVRQQHENKRHEYANRLEDIQAERELVRRHFEAIERSYADQERDLSLAIDLYDNGLNSLSSEVAKAQEAAE